MEKILKLRNKYCTTLQLSKHWEVREKMVYIEDWYQRMVENNTIDSYILNLTSHLSYIYHHCTEITEVKLNSSWKNFKS